MRRPLDNDLAVSVAQGVRREDGPGGDRRLLDPRPQRGVALMVAAVIAHDGVRGERLEHAVHVESGIGVDIVGDRFGKVRDHGALRRETLFLIQGGSEDLE